MSGLGLCLEGILRLILSRRWTGSGREPREVPGSTLSFAAQPFEASSVQDQFYKLRQSSSGYCLNFFIDTEKSEKTSATAGMLCREAVVIDLVEDSLPDGQLVLFSTTVRLHQSNRFQRCWDGQSASQE